MPCCVLSRFSRVQLFAALWTVARQAALGFSRQEYWSGLLCPPPGYLPNPRPEAKSLESLALAGGFLPLSLPGKPSLTHQFNSVTQSCPTLCDPRTAAHQSSLSIITAQSLFKLMSIKLVMPSNYLILYHPLLLLPSIFPSIRVFSNESVLRIRWPGY